MRGQGKFVRIAKSHRKIHAHWQQHLPNRVVELDEGPLISSQIIGDKKPRDIYDIGQTVEVVFEDHPNEGFTLPKFRIVG